MPLRMGHLVARQQRLLRLVCGSTVGAVGCGREQVDEESRHGHAQTLAGRHQIERFGVGHFGRDRDGVQGRACGIGQQTAEGFHLLGKIDHHLRDLGQPEDVAVFQEQRKESAEPLLHQLGHFQKAQQMAGGRRVENKEVVLTALHQIDDAGQGQHLIEPGWRNVEHALHHVAVKGQFDSGLRRAAAEDTRQFVCVVLLQACVLGLRIEFDHAQARRNTRLLRTDLAAQAGRQRMGRVNRKQQNFACRLFLCEAQRRRTGQRGLANAALAGEQQQLEASLGQGRWVADQRRRVDRQHWRDRRGRRGEVRQRACLLQQREQLRWPQHLVGEHRQAPEVVLRKEADQFGQGTCLARQCVRAQGAIASAGQQAVDEQFLQGQAQRLEFAQHHLRDMDAQGFGQQHRNKAAALGRMQQGPKPFQVGQRFIKVAVNHILLILALVELRQVAVLGQHGVERGDPFAHLGWQTEQAQRVASRCRVQHNAGVLRVLQAGLDFEQGHHLVQARYRQVQQPRDIALVEKGAAQGDRAQVLFVARFEACQALRGIDLAQRQIGGRCSASKAVLQ